MHILLLEDDTVLADILIDYLQESFEVSHTYSMKEALRLCDENSYDLYIFDINVPDGDGITLLKELRNFNDETPTIFITAFHDTKHLKDAFQSGGNDFIKKPFDLEELMQRIANIQRHFGLNKTLQLAPDITFEQQTHSLTVQGSTHSLGHKESECLQYLYQNRSRVVGSDELLQNLWRYDETPSEDTIRTLIKQLRKVLGKEHIINIRGEGYRFE
jgi:DNA-binding response OmpR family regulator